MGRRSPEARELAIALERRLGRRSVTADELATELSTGEAAEQVSLLDAMDRMVARRFAAEPPDEVDETVWGPAPSAAQLATAHEAAAKAVDGALRRVLADALTREQAAAVLGISPQAVSKRVAGDELVALRRGRLLRFPAWQLRDHEALPGLSRVIGAYRGSPLSLSVWATAPSADLDGATPAQMLGRRDGLPRVLDLLASVNASAW